MPHDAWSPRRYDQFAAERRLPADELIQLCRHLDGHGTIYDLGCGTGSLTAELGARLGASNVVGIDSSEAMLTKAMSLANGRADLRFELGDIASFGESALPAPPSIIFSNAALHWVDHHDEVIDQWRRTLAPDGQLAIQVPTNHDHPAYPLATTIAAEHPEWFPNGPPPLPSNTVLAPEDYAQLLHGLGAVEQHVSLRVFAHELDSTANLVDWLRGTTLLPFRRYLDQAARSHGNVKGAGNDTESHHTFGHNTNSHRDGSELFDIFCEVYRERLIEQEGLRSPYLFTFKRILMWARF